MNKSCCLTGFAWDGETTGTETKLANLPTYTSGSNSKAAILVISDLFGWTFPNLRLLCDHYAKEADATVYLPDFFDGEVLDAGMLADLSRWGEFDIVAWGARHSKEARWPSILASAKELRGKFSRVAVIGFCYGGWSSFALGSAALNPAGQPLVNCISVGHPTWLTKEEIDNVAVPVQIIAPEVDPVFTPEMKEYAWMTVGKKGLPLDYQAFPGVEHSFCTRGNPDDEKERRAMVRAKRSQAWWAREWLHGDAEW